MDLIHIILHLDQYLGVWAAAMGVWIYVLVFMIVFAETGLVVAPFLPGDSLLFALGALTTISGTGESALDFGTLCVLLVIAAFMGDNVNYFVGHKIGSRVFNNPKAKYLNPQNLKKTQDFYNKWGPGAVILARFAPFLRTFIPFVAGVGSMQYRRYITYSILGAVAWTQIFLWTGRLFGNIPEVKRNFHIVIIAVIVLSLMPVFFAWLKSKKNSHS